MLEDDNYYIIRIKEGEQIVSYLTQRIIDTELLPTETFCDVNDDDAVVYVQNPFTKRCENVEIITVPAHTYEEAYEVFKREQPQPVQKETSGDQKVFNRI